MQDNMKITETVEPITTGLGLVRPAYTEIQKRTLSWALITRAGLRHSYAGTVPKATIAKRRAANKVAKASRKANR